MLFQDVGDARRLLKVAAILYSTLGKTAYSLTFMLFQNVGDARHLLKIASELRFSTLQ